MGSIPDLDGSLQVRVLDATPSDALRAATVCAKLPGTVAEPILYSDARQCLEDLAIKRTDVLVVDVETVGGDEALSRFAVRCPTAVIIAVSAEGSVTRSLNAMRAGAHDFLVKPYSLDALTQKVRAHLDMRRSRSVAAVPQPRREADPLPAGAEAGKPVGRFSSQSQPMRHLYATIRRLGPSSAPVFITGEAGSGKTLCAEAIHGQSDRRTGRLVTVNCAGLGADELEAELFGSLTGSRSGRSELLSLADGGTLYLDEICDMDPALQSRLLRVIQTGSIPAPLGGSGKDIDVDIRLVCSTSRDPLAEVAAGRLREDLYYRLHVLPVQVPPLRDRRDDILPLAHAFLARFAGEEARSFRNFDADAEARLLSYGWPGNVRQLENTIRQIVVMNDGGSVSYEMLPLVIRDTFNRARAPAEDVRDRRRPARSGRPHSSIEPLWAQERRIIEDALDAFDGNIALAAAALEISPSTIYRKRQSWSERLQ
ncbi:response regulator [Microvirga tunisiensis]|uniref:Response regulator n=2 Tax=Pannonibacter tanglangensis TaxID=2750084 RepID=A0ABW9ZJ84_9HYPH|nr:MULTISPECIES: sigma-54 dependent transcriptional regulator [unclassified Pannonibacter]NBN64479.1 response regulator [Pannonibacter sp. XCT-34]NBN79011.1 response regulator [Pannonibacter sp. XCT-53]